MWKKMGEPDRPQMTMWRMRYARWIPNATNTHLEYVTFIASVLKQWLLEGVLMLRSRHIARLFVAPPSETFS
jgi:hypothetical protein